MADCMIANAAVVQSRVEGRNVQLGMIDAVGTFAEV